MNDENKKNPLTTNSSNFDIVSAGVLDEFIKQEADKIEFKYSNNLQNNFEKNNKNTKFSGLALIPKYKEYMKYIINLLENLPRTEKFNIGNEYKKIMYETFEYIMYLDKIDRNEKKSKMYYLNKIDTGLNIQREFLRIMAEHKWISLEKFNIAMNRKISRSWKNVRWTNKR